MTTDLEFDSLIRRLLKPSLENQETTCTLYGLIHTSTLEILLSRIEGLVGDIDVEPNLFELECVFVPKKETPPGSTRNEDKLIRLRAGFDPEDPNLDHVDLASLPWFAFSESPPEALENSPTVRNTTFIDIAKGVDPVRGLMSHGYLKAWEFVRKGYYYIFKNSVWLRVYRVYELKEEGNLNSLVALVDPKPPPLNLQVSLQQLEQRAESADGARGDLSSDNDPAKEVFIVEFIHTKPATISSTEKAAMLQTMLGFASLFQGIVELRSVSHVYMRGKLKYLVS